MGTTIIYDIAIRTPSSVLCKPALENIEEKLREDGMGVFRSFEVMRDGSKYAVFRYAVPSDVVSDSPGRLHDLESYGDAWVVGAFLLRKDFEDLTYTRLAILQVQQHYFPRRLPNPLNAASPLGIGKVYVPASRRSRPLLTKAKAKMIVSTAVRTIGTHITLMSVAQECRVAEVVQKAIDEALTQAVLARGL